MADSAIRVKTFLNILAVVGGVGGSALVAARVDASWIGYVLFLISSLSCVALLWKESEQRGLLLLNIYFVAINIYGLTNWIV
jgi:nicotinamide riboside transporter PnuC